MFTVSMELGLIYIFSTIIGLSVSLPLPQNVTYDLLENPNYKFGDIYFGDKERGFLRTALERDEFLWAGGIVPVQIHDALKEDEEAIVAALEYFHENTCIRFKPRSGEVDYLHIIRDKGCYSAVGRSAGPQALSLDFGCTCKGIIIHELMHTLGFYHEQNRPDRDAYIYVVRDNIKEDALSEFLRLEEGQARTFDTPYDYQSIMHYGSKAFSKNGGDTMVAKQAGVHLKHPCEKGVLTSIDFQRLNQLYRCSEQ